MLEKKERERQHNVFMGLFIGISILTPIFYVLGLNFLRVYANGTYVYCQSYLKNIGSALESYAKDNEGKYPYALSDLTPAYIKKIPHCPAVRKDTYSMYYRTSKDRKRYTFFCKGINHRDCGISEKNWPQYNSKDGLVARP